MEVGDPAHVDEVTRLAVVEKWPAFTNLQPRSPVVTLLDVVAWSLGMQTEKMAGERLILAVGVLFLLLSALTATFQCCCFLLSFLMNLAPFGALANFVYMVKCDPG